MKSVILTENRSIEVKDSPIPEIQDGEMLVKMQACGICGSDLEKVYGNYGIVSKRIGHEPAGVIVQLGA